MCVFNLILSILFTQILMSASSIVQASTRVNLRIIYAESAPGLKKLEARGLDLDGYWSENFSYDITAIEEASIIPPHPVRIIDQNGITTGMTKEDDYSINVKLPEDAWISFSKFTKKCIGAKVLISIGDNPIMAFKIQDKISNGQFTLMVGSSKIADTLFKALREVRQKTKMSSANDKSSEEEPAIHPAK